jgi:hypothetical protein
MWRHEGVDVRAEVPFTSAIVGCELQLYASAALTQGKEFLAPLK